MDLKAYYKKIREIEEELEGEPVVLVSLRTAEGGKEGVYAEAPRNVAARMIAESRSRVASAEEAEAYREELAERRRTYELEEEARRMRVMVIPASDLRKGRERG